MNRMLGYTFYTLKNAVISTFQNVHDTLLFLISLTWCMAHCLWETPLVQHTLCHPVPSITPGYGSHLCTLDRQTTRKSQLYVFSFATHTQTSAGRDFIYLFLLKSRNSSRLCLNCRLWLQHIFPIKI